LQRWCTSSRSCRRRGPLAAGTLGLGVVLAAIAVSLGGCAPEAGSPGNRIASASAPRQPGASQAPDSAAGTARKPLYYRNPMNPAVTSDRPAKDSMGMDYVPVYAEEGGASGRAGGPAEIAVAPGVTQELGVRTATAELSSLPNDVQAVGFVGYDEGTIRDLYAATAGWIESMAVRAVGEPVRAGEVLFQIYSPSLAIVDQQYLTAVAGGSDPVNNPYARGLGSLGVTEEMVTELREHRRAVGRLPYRAPAAGVVTALTLRQGAVVTQGAGVMRLASIDPAWVTLAVPQSAASEVQVGAPVSISVDGAPSRSLSGRIDFIYEDLDPMTHTLRVRVSVPNPDHLLKADMYVTALVHGPASSPVINVPVDAVIRDAQVNRVVVALADGRFRPRQVELGHISGERVAVTKGLAAGERVVTAGIFLLDSESQLRSGLARISGDGRPLDQPQPAH